MSRAEGSGASAPAQRTRAFRLPILGTIVALLCMACGPARPTPAPQPSDEVWLGTFRAPVTGEAVMFVLAEAPGTSWAQKGKEAAVLTVTMDGQYIGDLVLEVLLNLVEIE